MNKSRRLKYQPGEFYVPELLNWTPEDGLWVGDIGWFTLNQLVTHPECVVKTDDQLRTRIKLKKFAGCSLWQVMTTPTEKKAHDTTEFDYFLKVMHLFGTCSESPLIMQSR